MLGYLERSPEPFWLKRLHLKQQGKKKSGLKEYTGEEVSQHKTLSTGIWVIYKDGVYDITEFLESHPGGNKILLAAGGSIDPFWALYGQHQTDEVAVILEQLRVGNYCPTEDEGPIDFDDPYSREPKRHPSLHVVTQRPFNSETPSSLLSEYITPTELFYIRNHLPVPVVDPATYRLEIGGEGIESISLSLDQLKALPKVTVASTVQCAGMRRNDLKAVKPVRGLDWDLGSISTATWGGCRLSDVLAQVGVDDDNKIEKGFHHVLFEGMDKDTVKNYAASIPVEKALNKYGDVILAYEMNGEELPRDHGYPIRAIVPGTVGARNVKWVGKVMLSADESFGHWQRRDYKGFGPNIDWDTVDFDSAQSIQELPVMSAITEPAEGEKIDTEELTIKGFAWSGGGRDIYRVDISLDGGEEWLQADLVKPVKEQYNRAWTWTPWTVTVPITEDMEGKDLQICSKAVNSSYDVQPDTTAPIWNLRGVLSNAWHRVNVKVVGDEE